MATPTGLTRGIGALVIAVVPRRQILLDAKGKDNAGQGRIFRAALEIPKADSATVRTSKYFYDNLPSDRPESDLLNRVITDRSRRPPRRENTVNRASMDAAPGKRKEPEIVLTTSMEASACP